MDRWKLRLGVAFASGLLAVGPASCAALTSWDSFVDGPVSSSPDGGPRQDASDVHQPDTAPADSRVDDTQSAADTQEPNPGDSAPMGDTRVPPPVDSGPADSSIPPQDAGDSSPRDSTVPADTTVPVDSSPPADTSVADSSMEAAAGPFTVSGTIVGLYSQDEIQLSLNSGPPDLFGPPNFLFSTPLADGSAYAVAVTSNPQAPIAETCTVAMGTGTVHGANVTNVIVSCTTNQYTVAGTVSGYAGSGLQLNDGASTITVPATDSGTASFVFPPLSSGEAYSVAVVTNPTGPGAYCTASNNSGMIGASNVTGVQVTCVPVPSCSPVCTDGAGCVVNGDCGSGACAGTCQSPACAPGCGPGSPCGADTDCLSGTCSIPSCM